jgi:hypothetical protein
VTDETTVCPVELPEKPTGWTRQLRMHLNFGGGKGSGVYSIHDELGRRVEGISFGYNSREGTRGFILDAQPETHLTWSELRERYATFRRP